MRQAGIMLLVGMVQCERWWILACAASVLLVSD